MEFLCECVNLPADLYCLSLTRSLFNDNFGFIAFSVRLREAGEFRNYSLVVLSIFYECMFNTSHQDTSVTTVCCLSVLFPF